MNAKPSMQGQLSEPAAEKPTLLFVDDDVNSIRLLQRMFADSNYHCYFAESPEVALSIIADRPVDAIISDIRMPGMSGTELLAQIKQRHPDTVRIAMTGGIDFTDAIDSINKASVTQYLIKPVDSKTLKLTIYQELKKRERSRNEIQRLCESRKNAANRARALSQANEACRVNTASLQSLLAQFACISITDPKKRNQAEWEQALANQMSKELNLSTTNSVMLTTALALSHSAPELLAALAPRNCAEQALFQTAKLSGNAKDAGIEDIVYELVSLIRAAVQLRSDLGNWDDAKIQLCQSHNHLSCEILGAFLEMENEALEVDSENKILRIGR